MLKEGKKYLLSIVLASAILLSCGNSTITEVNVNQDSIKAEETFVEATKAYECEQNELALSLINKIDSVYVGQVSVRRKAMVLRPKIMEKKIRKDIFVTDSLIAVCVEKKDSINKINKLRIKKEKLERQLQVALNQQVRNE